jgi:hypothetical protein
MEQRILQLQNQIQVIKMLQHSMTQTLVEMNEDLANQTFTEVSRAYMTLESEVLRKQMEVSRLKLL